MNFLRGGISEKKANAIQKLNANVSASNKKYSKTDERLSEKNIKKLTHIEKLKARQELDDEIKKGLSTSCIYNLYNITKLSSEYIGFKNKETVTFVNKFLTDEKNINRIIIFQKACSSVDRASDSDSESRGFDSLHAYCIFCFKS